MEKRYDSNYGAEMIYKMTREELDRQKHPTDEMILAYMRNCGAENVRITIWATLPYEATVTPVNQKKAGGYSTLLSARYRMLTENVGPDNNPLDESGPEGHWLHPHKIALRPSDQEAVVAEECFSFYFTELCGMIRSGDAAISCCDANCSTDGAGASSAATKEASAAVPTVNATPVAATSAAWSFKALEMACARERSMQNHKRDKIIVEAMGYEFHRCPEEAFHCDQCADNIPMTPDFSTWEGFGILWAWLLEQPWLIDFGKKAGFVGTTDHHNEGARGPYYISLPERLLVLGALADATCDYLEKHKTA